MKKRILIIFSAITAVVLLSVILLVLSGASSYTMVVAENWGIELPQAGANEVFSYIDSSFHGDGVRYHVIDYPVGNETKKIMNSIFKLEKIFNVADYPNEEQVKEVSAILEEAGMTENVIPEWEKCKLIYFTQQDGSVIYIFYWYGTGTVYIVERFI